MPLPHYRRPALVLTLITPCLTELFSGNIPAPIFFLPWTFLFLVVVYSLPVLLIRDLWVRWKLSLPGLFLLGLAYGIYNEGVLAKTLLRSENVPINVFDHFTFLGINWPWAFLIVPWHALHAVIFPIAIITWLYPDSRHHAWLTSREFQLGTLLLIALGIFLYLLNKEFVTSPGYLIFFLVVIAMLTFFSMSFPGNDGFLGLEGSPTRAPAIFGFAFYPVFVIGLSILAACHLPGVVICLASLLLFAISYRYLVRRNWLSLIPFILLVFGDYLSGSLFTLFVSLSRGGWLGLIAFLVLITFFSRGIMIALRPKAAL